MFTNCCVFPMICGLGVSKSWLAKAAGAEVVVQQRHENHERLQAAVTRSTFQCQNAQNTPGSDHLIPMPLYAIIKNYL